MYANIMQIPDDRLREIVEFFRGHVRYNDLSCKRVDPVSSVENRIRRLSRETVPTDAFHIIDPNKMRKVRIDTVPECLVGGFRIRSGTVDPCCAVCFVEFGSSLEIEAYPGDRNTFMCFHDGRCYNPVVAY